MARLDVAAAAARFREARARLWPEVFIHGALDAATPPAYGLNEGAAQIVGRDSVYDGGRLRANVRAASADTRSAQMRFRLQEKDLAVQVTTDYDAAMETVDEIAFQRDALDRLRDYLGTLRERLAAGQGVTGDVLKTQVLVSTEESNLIDAERRHRQVLLELNYLMGRDPSAGLMLTPLPPPTQPAGGGGQPWTQVPDLQEAQANRAAAVAQIAAAKSGRRPHIDLTVTAGRVDALFGANDPANVNAVASATGASAVVSVQWPIWDVGLYRARLAQAQIGAQQAAQRVEATRQQARFEWTRASAQLADLYRQLQILQQAVPAARDAALNTESLYRGGSATSLEVLDAYRAWLDASRAYQRALQQYRDAEAESLRWGTP